MNMHRFTPIERNKKEAESPEDEYGGHCPHNINRITIESTRELALTVSSRVIVTVELIRAERGGVMCELNLVTVSRETVLRGALGSEPNSEM